MGRRAYYGVNGVPALKVDGYISGGSPTAYWTIIQARYHMEPPIEIQLHGSFDEDTRTGTLNIELTAIDFTYFEELFVRIALTESELYWQAPNGAVWHQQTMRDMIPNATGTSIEIDYGETVQLTQNFSVPSPLVLQNCDLVVWLQSDYMQEIYQTARVNVLELGPVDVDDEPISLPESFSLAQNYPNPFNANTAITYNLDNESSVDLAIYDLAGRKVAQLVDDIQGAGNHQVVWNGHDMNEREVSTGIYFYRLEASGQTQTRRMVLLK